MRYAVFILAISFITEPAAIAGDAHEAWKKELEKNEITVYTRKPEGSNLRGFKATSVFKNTSIEEVKDVIFDVEAYNEWINDCKSSEILDSQGKYDVTYYALLKVPFPFEKRDMVQQIRVAEETDASLKISFINKPEFVEVNRGTVRMPAADGYWLLQSLDNGDVSVVLEQFADPGGGIPAWMVNMFIVQSPYNMFLNLKELVEGD